MIREWQWQSKSKKAFLNLGVGQQDAVGAPQPSEAIPLQDGLRLLFAKGIDRIWLFCLIAAALHTLTHRKKHR
ncbi:MAG: hypothetical protein MJ071_09270 [Oscillospiraceae bacterium]|nr:hypothetical protein [Oscillospiraceae bacterium]